MAAATAGMDAMDAVALGARVQQVADKLLLKAQEARTKGNAGAAQALSESVNDLRHAAAVLVEQKRLLTVRQAEAAAAAAAAIPAPPTSSSGDPSVRARLRRNSSASSIVSMMSTYEVASVAGSVHHQHQHSAREPSQQQQHELVARLARVEKMLGKKSDEMKAKGNEGAANALQQSAAYVRAGSACINEQQLSLSALAASHDALLTQWRALTALLRRESSDNGGDGDGDGDGTDVVDDSATLARATEMAAELAALRAFVQSAFPAASDSSDVDALRAALQCERDALAVASSDREHLQQQVAEIKKCHAEEYLILREDIAILQHDKKELTQQLRDVERELTDRSERELTALQSALDAATAACEQLTQTLAARDAQVQQLECDTASWRERCRDEQQQLSECLAQTQRTHAAQLAALEQQLAVATAAARAQALQCVQADYAELQALLADCEQNLASELARSAALDAQVTQLERRHVQDVDALRSDHARRVDELTQQHAAAAAETNALRDQLAASAGVIDELTQAVDGYQSDCARATKLVGEHERELAQLRQQLERQDTVQHDEQRALAAALTALQTDVQMLQTSLESSHDAAATAHSVDVLALGEARELQRVVAAHLQRAASVSERLSALEMSERELRSAADAFLSDCEALFADRSGIPERSDGFNDADDDDKGTGATHERLHGVKTRVERALRELATLQQTLADERSETQRQRDAATAETSELQRQCMSANDAVHQLELRVESLAAENTALRSELTTIQESSVDGADRRERDVAELTSQLASLSSEFERYRARSHTALKKVEKRAELLNGMRKDNAALSQALAASKQATMSAEARAQQLAAQLRESSQTQQMLLEELQQRLGESAAALAASETERLNAQTQCERAEQELAAWSERLEREMAAVKEQASAAAAAEVADRALQVRECEAHIATLTAEIEALRQQVQSHAQHADAQRQEQDAAVVRLQRALSDQQAASERTRAELAAQLTETQAAVAERDATLERLSQELAQRSVESTATVRAATSSDADDQVAAASQTRKSDQRVTELLEQMREDAQRIASLESQVAALQQRLAVESASASATESEAENTQVPSESAAPKAVDVRDQAIRELRRQVRELQDQVHAFEEEHAAREHERERSELTELQTARQTLQKQHEHALQLKQRQAVVTAFKSQLHNVVDELTRGLDDHASAFRDACEFRDTFSTQRKLGGTVDDSADSDDPIHSSSDSWPADAASVDPAEQVFEECLVMKSGVVIKAGASFRLPVFCAKRGWRVVWTFSVKEDSADVGFALLVTGSGKNSAGATGSRQVTTSVVTPQRVNALSGVFIVDAASEGATLVFEWDNTFSWLNEKTLDYHVSVQEPLSPVRQQRHAHERTVRSRVAQLRDGLALLAAEATSRAQLASAVAHLRAAELDKDAHLAGFEARKSELAGRKSVLQQQMDELKASLSSMLTEQDEIEDDAATLRKVWDAAVAERDDAETTVHLADASQLEALAQVLEQQMQALEQQLQDERTGISDASVSGAVSGGGGGENGAVGVAS